MADVSWHGWREWNRLAGEQLLVECGGVDAGPEDSTMLSTTERLCRQFNQPCDVVGADAFNRRQPFFRLPADWKAVYQQHSGVIRADKTLKFLIDIARQSGARVIFNTRMCAVDPDTRMVSISNGQELLKYDLLIVTAGSWLPKIFPRLPLPLSLQRRVNGWYPPQTAANLIDGRLPVFRVDFDGG
jgi:glycine/D-amino acid oxidase-like deaminating enzyme